MAGATDQMHRWNNASETSFVVRIGETSSRQLFFFFFVVVAKMNFILFARVILRYHPRLLIIIPTSIFRALRAYCNER